jgi:hypothetical protein
MASVAPSESLLVFLVPEHPARHVIQVLLAEGACRRQVNIQLLYDLSRGVFNLILLLIGQLDCQSVSGHGVASYWSVGRWFIGSPLLYLFALARKASRLRTRGLSLSGLHRWHQSQSHGLLLVTLGSTSIPLYAAGKLMRSLLRALRLFPSSLFGALVECLGDILAWDGGKCQRVRMGNRTGEVITGNQGK